MRHLPRALLLVAVTVACGDGVGPGLDGPPFFSATLNGQAWPLGPSDQVVATLVPGGALLVGGFRQDSVQGPTDALGVFVPLFDTIGVYSLTHGVGIPEGDYSTYDPPPSHAYHSFNTIPAHPGILRVTAIDTARRLLAGSFGYQAFDTADSTRNVSIVGSFRVRYYP